MEQSLQGALDFVAEAMAKDFPEMSEAEVAFSTVRLNLTAVGTMLAQFGMTGRDLPNESLYGICTGLIETVEWMVAKDESWASSKEIEGFANGEA